MRHMLCGLVLGLVLVGPAAAQTKEQVAADIVGKWSIKDTIDGKEVAGVVEFSSEKDGNKMSVKAKAGGMEVSINGTYKVLDANSVEITYERKGETKKETSKVKVTKDNLEITSPAGTVMKYTRLK